MRRLLVVSPHFPPVNAADHQRVRHALPHLRSLRWEPAVIAVRPGEVNDAVVEPLLERTYPADIHVVRTGALPLRWTRRVGMGTLGWRCLPAVASAGARMLSEQRFDAVFFSTTQFPVMILGPRWQRRFGVPYFTDFQDPWVSDYHTKARRGTLPPGGVWKYRIAQWLARRFEPSVVRAAAGNVCVSEAYPAMLRRRYPDVTGDRFSVLPFSGSAADFDVMDAAGVRQDLFDPTDGREHWVYAGRGQADMAKALEVIFGAFARLRAERPRWAERVTLHFIGTSYAGGEKTVEPVAERHGLAGLVREHPRRVPYFQVLRCLREANGLLIPGSDDPGYTASKIYPYLLAEKPILAVFHRESGAVQSLESAGAKLVRFNKDSSLSQLVREAEQKWVELLDAAFMGADRRVLAQFSPEAMTQRLVRAFDRWLPTEGEASRSSLRVL